MLQFIQYYGRVQGVRGRMLELPGWARFIIGILAIPGILLLALSILAVVVSILALLLLTVPVYRLLSAVLLPARDGVQTSAGTSVVADPEPFAAENPNRRRVDVRIIE